MQMQPPKDRRKAKVVEKYRKLYTPLMELIGALQDLEPGGTLVDDTVIDEGETRVRIAYVSRPIMLTIKDRDRTFIVRVIEDPNS